MFSVCPGLVQSSSSHIPDFMKPPPSPPPIPHTPLPSPRQSLCAWGIRDDGSVRLQLPWKGIKTTLDNTPLRSLLSSWLREAPRVGRDRLPLINLFCSLGMGETDRKVVFFKGYRPREGRMEFYR